MMAVRYFFAAFLLARKYYLILRYYPRLRIKGKIVLGRRVKLVLERGSLLTIDGTILLMDEVMIHLRRGAIAEIGNGCVMNRFTSVVIHSRISIGDNVMMGENVKIYDNDHKIIGTQIQRREFETSPVVIGDGCWLANHAIVMRGTQMGPNTALGALSLASGTLDSNALYMGVPARKIKNFQ
jgi:acetyltransferase-like isoleucine patch superfamily enzyme